MMVELNFFIVIIIIIVIIVVIIIIIIIIIIIQNGVLVFKIEYNPVDVGLNLKF